MGDEGQTLISTYESKYFIGRYEAIGVENTGLKKLRLERSRILVRFLLITTLISSSYRGCVFGSVVQIGSPAKVYCLPRKPEESMWLRFSGPWQGQGWLLANPRHAANAIMRPLSR